MPGYKNIDNFFDEKGPEDIERFVDKNVDISQQVFSILKAKGWSQKDLAKELEKSDAEVSKWLSGMHNLTLKSITKMEAVLGEDIILTPLKAAASMPPQKVYVTVQVEAPNRYIPTGGIPIFSTQQQEPECLLEGVGNAQYAMAA